MQANLAKQAQVAVKWWQKFEQRVHSIFGMFLTLIAQPSRGQQWRILPLVPWPHYQKRSRELLVRRGCWYILDTCFRTCQRLCDFFQIQKTCSTLQDFSFTSRTLILLVRRSWHIKRGVMSSWEAKKISLLWKNLFNISKRNPCLLKATKYVFDIYGSFSTTQ